MLCDGVKQVSLKKRCFCTKSPSTVCFLHLPFLLAPTPPLLLQYICLCGKRKRTQGMHNTHQPTNKGCPWLKFNFFSNLILFKSGKKDKSGITSFLNPYLNLKSKWKSVNEKVWNTPIKLPFCTIINLNSNKATTIIHLQWALCNIIGQVQGTIRKKEKVNE